MQKKVQKTKKNRYSRHGFIEKMKTDYGPEQLRFALKFKSTSNFIILNLQIKFMRILDLKENLLSLLHKHFITDKTNAQNILKSISRIFRPNLDSKKFAIGRRQREPSNSYK